MERPDAPSIEEILSREGIIDKKVQTLQKNAEIVRSIRPTCDSLKRENLKLRVHYDVYNLKLERLSRELEEIEANSRRLELEIRNKTAVFDALKTIVVNLEMCEEYCGALDVAGFETPEDLAKIEEALDALVENPFEGLDILAVKGCEVEVKDRMKAFIKKFKVFFGEFLESIESLSEGQLRVHSLMYDSVKKYEFIFRYSNEMYRYEFERHLSVLQKLCSEKSAGKMQEGLRIFVESFFMIVKCEVHFCKSRLFGGEDVTEFVLGIFKGVFDLVLGAFHSMFKQRGLALVCALNDDFAFELQNEERDIWSIFLEKMRKFREHSKNTFLIRERDDCASRSRARNLDRCMEHIKLCNDLDISEKLVEMITQDITRNKREDLEDLIHTLKLLYRLRSGLKEKPGLSTAAKELDDVIGDKLQDLEREGIGYIFGGNDSKVVKRTKTILSIIDNNRSIMDSFKRIVFDNANDEQRRELQTLF
ncbi:UNVERIFIED_CONTAM: hypothetical protein PYX00_011725 [Menopon gallinae]|uniref:Exocyst complex component Sec3 coiled-coil domain-containing protein n=1 Tax=Menopon gallinae TaxID=328185 RepID=A0AAW2H8H8_9NEOP